MSGSLSASACLFRDWSVCRLRGGNKSPWPEQAAVLLKGMTAAAVMVEGRATRVWLPCSMLLTRPAGESFKP